MRFANPGRFGRLASALTPWLAVATCALFAVGLWMALGAPLDRFQGESTRIMYVHVPAAWMAMGAYAAMASAAFVALVWRHAIAALFVKAAAPLGAGFTAICLATGSLWGRPTWGTWWVWDGRLTSVLVLLFLYLGVIALIHAFDDRSRGLKAGCVLVLVGVVNLPIIRFSVDWWSTLHQPASVLRLDGPTIHASMLVPLLVMGLAYMTLFTLLALIRTRTEIDRRRLEALQAAIAYRASEEAPAHAAPPNTAPVTGTPVGGTGP